MEGNQGKKRTVLDFTRKFTNFRKPQRLRKFKIADDDMHGVRVGPRQAHRPTMDIIHKVNTKKVRTGDISEDEVDAFLQRVHEDVPLVIAEKSHAKARFRATVMQHRTPQDELRKHVVEKWTRTYLSGKLCLIGSLSLLVIYFGVRTWAGEVNMNDNGSAVGGPLFVCSGVVLLLSTLLGIYGVKRVPKDLLVDDDGMGTPGQRMLEVYFHISFLYALLMTPVALMELLQPGSLVGEAQFDMTGVQAMNASISSLVVIAVMCTALRSTVMIVTVFEMAHHFLEHFALILATLGCLGVALGISLVQFSQFLFTSTFTTSLGTILFCFVGLCIVLVSLSLVGFLGASLENGTMLKVYAICIAVVGIVIFALVCTLSAVPFESIVFDHCREILQTMSHDWWLETIGCHKYGGAEIGALVEGYSEEQGYHYVVSGFGEEARCPSKDMIAYVWEANSNPDSGQRAVNTSTESVIYQGCLHEECCNVLFDRMNAISTPLIVSVMLLILCIGVACKASFWLRGHVRKEKERVKRLSQRRARVLLAAIIVLCLIALALCVSVYLGSRRQLSVDQIVKQINVQIPSNSTIASSSAHSCSNGVRDGNESDVDCGGDPILGGCSASCFAGRTCATDSDCESDKCNATTSVCDPMTLEQKCTNGVQDSLETDVDCGGPECRGLRLDEYSTESFLCSLGQKCVEDGDCASQSCHQGVCSSCNDGVKNEDEGDIDCGSDTCIRYRDVRESGVEEILSFENRTLESNTSDADGLCLDGFSCSKPDQCSSGVCFAGMCSSCLNGEVDNDESDVDCGGRICAARCSIGRACLTDTDCSSGWCSGSCSTGVCSIGICLSPLEYEGGSLLGKIGTSSLETVLTQCSDGNLSEHETDIDCGGDFCSLVDKLCPDNSACVVNRDCLSGRCDPVSLTCTNCYNGVKDGSETDVDCGGTCAKKCSLNATCSVDSDCINAHFCWTKVQRDDMTALLNSSTDQFSLEDFYFPESGTCQLQPKINIGVKALPYVFTNDADISDIFDMPSLAPIDEEPDDETRRLLRGRKFLALSRRRFPGTYIGQLPLGAWRFACTITLAVEGGLNSRLELLEEDARSTRVIRSRNRRRLFMRLGFGRRPPKVQVQAERCRLGEVSMRVTFRIILGNFCGFMRLSTAYVSTSLVPVRTVVNGRVISACSNQDQCASSELEGAQIKLWANRLGTCVNNVSAASGDCPASCDVFTSFDACSSECCSWEDANHTALSSCFTSGEYTSAVAFVTGVDGSFSIQWPEFKGISLQKHYYLNMLIEKEGFVPLRAEIRAILPGIKSDIGDFRMLPRVLSLNQTQNQEKECCTGWLFAMQTSSARFDGLRETIEELTTRLLTDTYNVPNRVGIATFGVSTNVLVEESNSQTLVSGILSDITATTGNTSLIPLLKAVRDVSFKCATANIVYLADGAEQQHATGGVIESTFRSRQAESSRFASLTNICVHHGATRLFDSTSLVCDNAILYTTTGDAWTTDIVQGVLNASRFQATNCSFAGSLEAQPGIDVETATPTASPQAYPTQSPLHPTTSPSLAPSLSPTTAPSHSPSLDPSNHPSLAPSEHPTVSPSLTPSISPTYSPTLSPSKSPTLSPSTSPSLSPTVSPTTLPTDSPSLTPSASPTVTPSTSPTSSPSKSPSTSPTSSPSMTPSDSPSSSPSLSPSTSPSQSPSMSPTQNPSTSPSVAPSLSPTEGPTLSPSLSPSLTPSYSPSDTPTASPKFSPTTGILSDLCLEYGVEYIGADIGIIRAGNVAECHGRCGHSIYCHAYSYYPESQDCYLKGSNVEVSLSVAVVSGKRDCSMDLGSCEREFVCANEDERCECDGWIYYGRSTRKDSGGPTSFDELASDQHALFDNRGGAPIDCSNHIVASAVDFTNGDPLPRVPKKCYCVPTSCTEEMPQATKQICRSSPGFSPHLDEYCALSDCSLSDLCQLVTVPHEDDAEEVDCNYTGIVYIEETHGCSSNTSYSGGVFTHGMSLSMWISLNGLVGSKDNVLATFGSASYSLQLTRSGYDGFELRANDAIAASFEGFFDLAEGHARWIHISLTIDDFGYTKLYKDADLFASMRLASHLVSVLPSAGQLALGPCSDCIGVTCGHSFRSVGVYSRVLSSSCVRNSAIENAPPCTEWNPCPCSSGWMKVYEQVSCSVVTDLGPLTDLLFSTTAVVRYDINDEPLVYYRPLRTRGHAMSFQGHFINGFNSSAANEEYALYSTHEDYSKDWSRLTTCPSMPNNEGLPFPADCVEDSWSNAHCARSGGASTFAYYICVPDIVPLPIIPQYRRRQSFRVSGKVTDAETNLGVEARIDLFEGIVYSCESRRPDLSTYVSYNLDPMPAQGSSCSRSGNDTALLSLTDTEFTFMQVEEGTYTICAVHEAFIRDRETALDDGDVHLLPFTTTRQVVEVNGRDTNVDILTHVTLPDGAMRVVLTYKYVDDLDLNVQFTVDQTTGETCSVGPKLLSDGSCKCGGAAVTRDDQTTTLNFTDGDVAKDVIYLDNVMDSNYTFYISRPSKNPQSSRAQGRKYLFTGFCGKFHPLPNGEASQCATDEIPYEDTGITEARPCCFQGRCTNSPEHCQHARALDYRVFQGDDWQGLHRSDGRCMNLNFPVIGDDSSPKGYCPTQSVQWLFHNPSREESVRPCCNRRRLCEVHSPQACTCDRCVDFTLVGDSGQGELYDELAVHPTELSEATVTVYMSQGSEEFRVPDTATSMYFDSHVFSKERTESSTYTRIMCVHGNDNSPQIYGFVAPFYFQWKRQLLEMSGGDCPGRSECSYLSVSGFLPRADGLDLNGRYLQRYTRKSQFRTHVGYRVLPRCHIRVDGTRTVTNSHVQICLDMCASDSQCHGVLHWVRWRLSGTTSTCRFYANAENCGGIFVSRSRFTTFEKLHVLPSPQVWYSKLDDSHRVNLYRDEHTGDSHRWYFDNDLLPSNGYYSYGINSQGSFLSPSRVSVWQTLLNLSQSAHQLEPLNQISFVSSSSACSGNGLAKTLQKDLCSQAKICENVKLCQHFILRLRDTELCLHRSRTEIVVTQCDDNSRFQRWYTNFFSHLIGTGRDAVDPREMNITDAITIGRYEETLVYTCGIVLTEKRSRSPCTLEESFGWTPDGHIYVNRGCRATFTITKTQEAVSCNSWGYKYSECTLRWPMPQCSLTNCQNWDDMSNDVKFRGNDEDNLVFTVQGDPNSTEYCILSPGMMGETLRYGPLGSGCAEFDVL